MADSLESRIQINLLDLLSNILVFSQTAPYLPVSALVNLSAASKSFRALVYNCPTAFRRLDLSTTKGASEVFERMDESITEEDFYCGPLRGIFSTLKKYNVLANVQTLILDGQCAPVEILREIICEDAFKVQLLSILGTKNLNDGKFRQLIRYAIRPGRPPGTPKVKGIYYFGTPTTVAKSTATWPTEVASTSSLLGVTQSVGAQLGSQRNPPKQTGNLPFQNGKTHPWYERSVVSRRGGSLTNTTNMTNNWASTLLLCHGIIAWDLVLCRAPQHLSAPREGSTNLYERAVRQPRGGAYTDSLTSRVCPVSVALGPQGCQTCHTSPEGPGTTTDELPLLAPPPRHSSSVKIAQQIPGHEGGLLFFARCYSCLDQRYCDSCGKWWCEDCYQLETENGGDAGDLETTKGGVIKVYQDLCVEDCLVGEMFHGAGSGGMWG